MVVSALLTVLLTATMVPQTIEQLTDRATLVVRATVGSQHAERTPGPGGISTFTELKVVEVLKGSAPASTTLRQTGGTVGNQKLDLPGDATFAPGEDVLAFLVCRPAETSCRLVGLAQGKFHLQVGADGSVVASRDFHDVAFVRGTAPGAGPDAYAALARRIRAQVGAAR